MVIPNPDGIRRELMEWYGSAKRDLPWRRTRDPYRIWVSEIMLQQTRVAAVIPYYERFLRRFPDVASLAAASESELLHAWSGLGYYSRVRNMQKAAVLIAGAGAFPSSFCSIRMLPGIGSYTAAAIASIAFGLPHAALDGNIIRVIARLAAEKGDTSSVSVRHQLQAMADSLLDRTDPGAFNQALMELGATVCLPHDPQCLVCPLARRCEAKRMGEQRDLPVKLRRNTTVRESKTLLVVERSGKILMRRRGPGGRLAGMWELPDLEQLCEPILGDALGEFRHSILNRTYLITVMRAGVRRPPDGYEWISKTEIERIPLATASRKALALA